jgi:hypothetical protein
LVSHLQLQCQQELGSFFLFCLKLLVAPGEITDRCDASQTRLNEFINARMRHSHLSMLKTLIIKPITCHICVYVAHNARFALAAPVYSRNHIGPALF